MQTYIAPSALHGMGLFAAEHIPNMSIICEYTGARMKAAEDKSNHDYTYCIGDEVIIGDGNARNINDSIEFRPLTYAETVDFFCKKSIPRCREYNCEFIIKDNRVFVRAITDISTDTELFIDYGFRYWFIRFIKAGYIDRNYPVTTYTF